MKVFFIFLTVGFGIAALAPVGHSNNEAVLLLDSILEEQAHNFPRVTFALPTVHGVTFQQEGILTYEDWQYAAYYNGIGLVSVGRRPLPDGQWETLSLPDYTFTRVDSHNSVVLGICKGDGTVHLAFDHHGAPLKYRVSVPGAANDPERVSWTPDLFGPITDTLEAENPIAGLTYPRFVPAPDGTLLFTFRTGGSGRGDEILYEYDGSSGEWTRIGMYVSREGDYNGTFTEASSSRNAYADNTLFDPDGRLHMTWCWRELGDPRSNHDLSYAYSDDHGRTWKNSSGIQVAEADVNPLRLDSEGVTVWEIPQNRNYINNSAMTVDAEGRVHVVAWHYPDSQPDQTVRFKVGIETPARFHHYWRDHNGKWHRTETNLTGSRAKLVVDDDNHLYLAYGGADNIQIATASPETAWADWAEMNLSASMPEGRAREVNIVLDPLRWKDDRVLSVYAQETNVTGTGPTPLHILDYQISRSAVLPRPPHNSSRVPINQEISWTAGRGAVAHDVYFGPDKEAVEAATPRSEEYQGRQPNSRFHPKDLSPETHYFWRVDAVGQAENIVRGRTWSLKTTSMLPAAMRAR